MESAVKECPMAIARVHVREPGRDEAWALVDGDLYAEIVKRKWYAHKARKGVYVRSWDRSHKREYLHHLVQRLRRRRRPSKDHVVRHLSGDTFDNTDTNLRWGTKKANQRDAAYKERKR